ncbi:MAG: immunoglobulin domain-containing protein [Planctomycetes bacterium]|nr:immunoglobulin domain-containing protein [Planctomycetota bacterium]
MKRFVQSIRLANLAFGAALALGVSASAGHAQDVIAGAGPAAALASAAGTTKVTVERDALSAFRTSDAGAKAIMIGEYGAFSVFRINEATAPAAVVIPGVERRDDFDQVMVRRGAIDSRAGWRAGIGADPAQRNKPERNLGLVQLQGPVSKTGLAALEATGARIVHYLPQNAYIVWTETAGQREQILDQVGDGKVFQFFDDFLAEDALSPDLDTRLGEAGDVEVTVQVYNVANNGAANAVAVDRVQQVLGFATGVIHPPSAVLNGLYTNMTIRVPAMTLPVIAALDAVVNVEPYIAPTMNSERQAQEMAGNLNAGGTAASGAGYLAWLNSRGFPTTMASYPLLTMADDGLDNGSTSPLDQTLRVNGAAGGTSRIISNVNATSDATGDGVQGHGHLNTTIAMGYDIGLGVLDNVYLRALGISPYGRIAGMKIFTNAGSYNTSRFGNTDVGLIAAEYNQGADMSSNSWGAAVSGAYNATAQAYDSGTRDATSSVAGNQQLFFIFSAGNSGSGARTIGSPGTAKNVLTVGASEDTDNDGTDGCAIANTGADNIQQIISFSSRGPCADGRKKPEIVAPGTHVTGRANPLGTYNGTGVCDQYWPSGQTIYARSSGTSHSTPAVAGMASLAWNYLNRQYGITRPSPALLKAFTIHTARYLNATGGTLPDAAQGYGFANMDLAFSAAVPRIIVDQTNVLAATGASQSVAGAVADSTKPVRVALVWTDAPGSTAGNAWVNDLNLSVTVNGVTYKGNVFSGSTSISGGTADASNNYECVFLPAGTTGPMTVTVTAANIAGDGVPGNADTTDQDYALVVYNMTQTGVALSGTGANAVADNTGNGNNNTRIDPGETSIGVTVPVQNSGPDAATGVSATLVSNTPTVSVTTATAAYPNLSGGGGSGSNTTPFVLNVSASHTCGTPISLTLNIASAQGSGVYNFTLPTGQAGSNSGPTTFAYTGPAAAIPDNNATGVSVNLPVSGLTGTISGLKLRFDGSSCNATAGSTTVGLDHTYVGDLTISLQSPSGTVVTVMSRPGGTANSGNNFCGTVLDDAGASSIQSISSAAAPWTGTFSPNSPLSAFNGQSPNGTWVLKVVDSANVDTGNVRAFSLLVSTQLPASCDPPGTGGCVGPSITTNPVTQTVCAGTSVSFSAEATGSATLGYQWRKGTNPIGGATSSTFTIPSPVAGDAGSYDCVVTNGCGTATSNAAILTVNVGPGISAQPSPQTVCAGSPASFSVTATGTPTPSYQWRKGTTPIGGATSSTFSIGTVAAGDAANYDCVITNSCGSVTTNAVALTVNSGPSIGAQPQPQTVCAGTGASFSVTASGTPTPTYQWRKNTVNIGGATSNSYSIGTVAAGDAASYDCVVTNSCGSVTSNSVLLSVNTAPNITGHPVTATACAGTSVTYSVTASGTPAPSYQWRKNNSNIGGATSASYTIPSVVVGDVGFYDCVITNTCGSVTSNGASLNVNTAPSISGQPVAAAVCDGSPASFSVSASGTPTPTYQWRKNTINIGGATSSTYSIGAVAAGDAATYDCVVTNSCGTVTSNGASLTVNSSPVISGQPQSQTACAGSAATFSVTASGSPTPTYQWRRNTSPIGGATSASYSIASVVAGDAASYDCVITNSCGTVTSGAGLLTVTDSPVFTTEPSSVTVCESVDATFTVAATGATSYQWRLNTSPIGGANSPSYTVAASVSNAGSYDCVATNSCGSVTSAAATLNIGGPAPANDDIAGAILLSEGVAQAGNTCAATVDSSAAPECGGQLISAPGVWFKVQGTGSSATVALCGSSYDTRLSAYCGQVGGLTCVAGNDDFCGVSSSVTFCTQAGADYYVLVHGFGVATGAFTILYTDDGVACTPVVRCISIGACCLPTGCEQLTPAQCALQGGTYQGDAVECDQPTYGGGFSSSDSFPIGIPDGGTSPGIATSTMNVPSGSGTVSSLAVRVGLDHTYCGDLTVTLSNGTVTATLFSAVGGSNNLAGVYTFADAASIDFAAAAGLVSPIAGGAYKPADALGAFDGQSFDGVWTLTVTDDSQSDVGNINSFELLTTTISPACGTSCPACAADYNQDGGVDGTDVNSFFADWESGLPCSDVNLDGGVDGADVDTFFVAWENGGC